MLKHFAIIVAFVLILIQFIRPARTNPPSPEGAALQQRAAVPAPVRDILDRSCRDCHSNLTAWPWYSGVAPVSWIVNAHVKDARRELNFSEWGLMDLKRTDRKLQDICEQVERGEMPPKYYTPFHPPSRLSAADREAICAWTKLERERLAALPPATPAIPVAKKQQAGKGK